MDKPIIGKDCMVTCFESKYLNVIDLQYAEGRHYYDASRHKLEDFVVLKSEEEFKKMLPDAVTCFVILKAKDEDYKLLLMREYRYPVGQFLTAPPAGLMDPEDKNAEIPQFETAKREIFEETGIEIEDKDRLILVNPLAFSTPGMTDESNALVCAVIEREELPELTSDNTEGSECMDGYMTIDREEAKKLLRQGKDDYGFFYSMYTWAALMYFISDIWREE